MIFVVPQSVASSSLSSFTNADSNMQISVAFNRNMTPLSTCDRLLQAVALKKFLDHNIKKQKENYNFNNTQFNLKIKMHSKYIFIIFYFCYVLSEKSIDTISFIAWTDQYHEMNR